MYCSLDNVGKNVYTIVDDFKWLQYMHVLLLPWDKINLENALVKTQKMCRYVMDKIMLEVWLTLLSPQY